MSSLIVVRANFEADWPFVADHFRSLWQAEDETELIRVPHGDGRRLGEIVAEPRGVTRLVSLCVPITAECLRPFDALREAAFLTSGYGTDLPADCAELLENRAVKLYRHHSEGFWGQSVSECALALTLCALRRIPQQHHEILTSHWPWERYAASRNKGPGTLGAQFCDDVRFTHGTLAGKRVRIVGVGNIGSRFASFAHMMGADVAAWDPCTTDPSFHRSGARKVWHLEELVADAEIFAPMLPLNEDTEWLIKAAHIDALPKGCLVVLVTRAFICDMGAVRRRVLAGELSLAADVFDVEPLPLDDPLLGRDNVVHTPHIAGRTLHANRQWAEGLAAQFEPVNA